MNRKPCLTLVLALTLVAMAVFGGTAQVQADAPAANNKIETPPLSWQIVTVDTAGDVGQFASLAINPTTSKPVIAYYDASNGRLKEAVQTTGWTCGSAGAGWLCGWLITNAGDAGQHTSVAFTSSGFSGFAFHNATYSAGHFIGAVGPLDWYVTADPFDTGNGITGQYNSLKYDSNDLAHIAYAQASPYPSALRYSTFAGDGNGNCGQNNGWRCVTIENGGALAGRFASLDFSYNDTPYIAYSGPAGELKLAHYVGGSGNCGPLNVSFSKTWQCDVIDAHLLGEMKYISLHVPKCQIICLDRLQIAYYDWTTGGLLKYARFVGSGGNCGPANDWQCDTIETVGSANVMGVSLGVHDSKPMIAYYDADDRANGLLKVAQPTDTIGNCGPNGGLFFTWQCDVIDDGLAGQAPAHNVGQYAALGWDGNGVAHIAYYDATSGDLKVAEQISLYRLFTPLIVR